MTPSPDGLRDLERQAVLQQLSSPALPIGGFTYSQGLEAAVELGLVHDEASAGTWIEAQLNGVVADCEAPLWCLLFLAWTLRDTNDLRQWNEWFQASRETQEIRQETEQMGRSLVRLIDELAWGTDEQRAMLKALRPPTLPLAHSFACAAWEISALGGLSAYLFTWLENQVAAAIKSVPLGQTAGQRILDRLRRQLPILATQAYARSQASPPALHTLAPQYGIVSSRHATQFSRLFRS